MKTLLFLLCALASTAYALDSLPCPALLTAPLSPAFEVHESSKFVALNLPYGPAEKLRHDLEKTLKQTLRNRGESHVTVIAPPEFEILIKVLSVKDLEAIVRSSAFHSEQIKAFCVGSGSALLDSRRESVYFVVLQAPELLNLRLRIAKAFVARGGKASEFNARDFYPHITLGFTRRDLHEGDGIVKDAKSCLYTIEPPNTVPPIHH